MSESTPPILSIKGLTKKFSNHTAVNQASFDVQEGDIFGFLGPNGAGKSTTLYMISGLVHPTSGSIRIFGKPHTDLVNVRPHLGILIEVPAFYEYLCGRVNLQILARIQGGPDLRRIDEVLDRVGLLDRAGDRVFEYSHGMRQRLGIAQAMMHKPRLLLLDEPTNGLDPEGSAQMWQLLREVVAQEKTTILISSHLLHEVEEGCNRIAVINQGIIVACDHVRNLLFFSKEDYLFLFDTAEKREAARNVVLQREGTEVLVEMEGMTQLVGEDFPLYLRLQTGLSSEVLSELVSRDISPKGVIPQRKTLKQFFLELTRRQPGRAG